MCYLIKFLPVSLLAAMIMSMPLMINFTNNSVSIHFHRDTERQKQMIAVSRGITKMKDMQLNEFEADVEIEFVHCRS